MDSYSGGSGFNSPRAHHRYQRYTKRMKGRTNVSAKALARTFIDDTHQITVEVLTGPSLTGLCKVAYGDRLIARHIDRLDPITTAAKELLRKN